MRQCRGGELSGGGWEVNEREHHSALFGMARHGRSSSTPWRIRRPWAEVALVQVSQPGTIGAAVLLSRTLEQ
jgi:hypothetical protein